MQKHIHQLLAATLLLGGSLSSIPVARSQSTPAATTISNTATATYNDASNNSYNATSNTVTVTVAEVPGITITAQPPTNVAPNGGDTLTVDFVISNVGNDPTQFYIPNTATLSDSTNFSINGPLQIVAVNGNAITPKDVTTSGTTGTLLGLPQGSIAVAPGGASKVGTVTVRVPIKVNASASAGVSTTVSLGDTPTPNAQNVDRGTNTSAKSVYTVDNSDSDNVPGETPGMITQQNEAMATSATIAVSARLQAFTSVLKAVSSYDTKGTPNNFTDDVLTYTLALKVDNPATVPTGLAASDLYGTKLNLQGGDPTKSYVLVSDAIPAQLQPRTADIKAPTNWITVYSTDDPAVTTALSASWTTTPPTSGITRVGFIYDASATPLSKGAVGTGTMISGFVVPMNLVATFKGGQIANIAQVFGQSQPGAVKTGTPTQIVYDESGDQTDNNGLVGADPTTIASDSGGITDGVARPDKDGIDPSKGTDPTDATSANKTNQGQDSNNGTKTIGGEDTVYTIAVTPLNGPNGQPAAVGPTSNNDDFTNQSIKLPVGKDPNAPLAAADISSITFNNTIQNTSGAPQAISLLPTPPTPATDLPNGTTVTLTDPVSKTSATYSYAAGKFTLTSGSTVTITVAAGTTNTAQYQTTVQLPAGVLQLQGFPVPIAAFINTDGTGNPANNPSNITIDRVYTGYVKLDKAARILDTNANGNKEIVGWTKDSTLLSPAAQPGRIIEYRIQYSNLSTVASANSGSIDLAAKTLVITEDGTATPNNWFTVTKDSVSGTIPGSATDPSGTISGTSNSGDIQVYIDTISTLNPQASGTFTFRRQIK